MIMHGNPPNDPGPLLIIIDGRGGHQRVEMAHWLCRKAASRLGIDSDRIGLWPTESRPDLWSLPADRAIATLEALIRESQPPDEVI
ncbi:hypothetical protein [Nocardia sp. NPDC046763]|uniref:hypothetical protein n=1 Tax=Nocardia sp. NPDC046763 TaxID=3155256 RepID=UPI0033FC1CC4